ncbi:hypothetical protein ACFLTP_00600 [Chloroflexota bacterium]
MEKTKISDGGSVDEFYVRIRNINIGNAVVYDNRKGEPYISYTGTELNGGSIIICKDK